MISQQATGAYRPDARPAENRTPGLAHATIQARWASLLEGFKLPRAALARLVVLLGALVLVKLALLLSLGKHLHEIHWRIGGTPQNWINHAIFFAFISLGVWSLVALGRHCQTGGIQAVRGANTIVLGLGLLFIFLTFHEGDKNYLYPVMTGTLEWKNLAPYLSLNLFFRPPFLAAWLTGYGLLYYLLVRSGRERWALHWTAGFAGAYGLLCLRELVWYRNELAVAACFGLAALLCLRHPNARLNLVWLLLPLAWVALALGIFYAESKALRNLNPYLRMIAGWSTVLFAGATLFAGLRGFRSAWLKVAPFYLVAFFLLSSANYPMAENYNHLMSYALQLPHYFMGEVLLAGLLTVAVLAYTRWRPGASFLWLDVAGLLLVALALVDFRLSQVMGVRLGWDLLAFGNSPAMMWRMAQPYLVGVTVMLIGLVVVYALLLKALNAWLERNRVPAGEGHSGRGAWYVVACFLLLGASGLAFVNPDNAKGQAALRLAQTSPWWKRASERTLGRDELLQAATTLGLGDFAVSSSAQPMRPRRDLNVVLVLMESSYNQHLSLFSGTEETQPLLSAYKDRMEIFPNFFANYASSIHARFAVFAGLYPVKDYNAFTLKRVGVRSIFEVLKEHDYDCSMFYSSYFDYTGFRSLLSQRGLEMYDADTMPGERTTKRVSWGLREEETLGAIRQRIQRHAADQSKFFLTYVPAAPHYPYDSMPERFRKYKLSEYQNYTPLYLNELLYMDWVITSIVDQLKESGLLDRTLVVITSDHGEMLGGKDSALGHGWAVTPELANVPLVIMDPGQPGYRINETIGSHIDLLPTILETLGIPSPETELYAGRSLYTASPEPDRLVYLNSYRQYGVLTGRHLVLGDRSSDKGELNPIHAKTYLISNEGSRTVFIEDSPVTNLTVSMRQFDEFQEGLLRNYSHYREAVSKGRLGETQYARP